VPFDLESLLAWRDTIEFDDNVHAEDGASQRAYGPQAGG
jgi:hypothetical protein